ncbi:MAG TPA: hypothetical protein ENH28_02015, partial [Euryarchaeota archaeon]|nr:hypothetical protein [Euryarchaeota archaeon]
MVLNLPYNPGNFFTENMVYAVAAVAVFLIILLFLIRRGRNKPDRKILQMEDKEKTRLLRQVEALQSEKETLEKK